MNKPAQIRLIYAELRRSLPDVAGGELLKIAHLFLRAYSEHPDDLSEFGLESEGRPFLTRPVDEAMSDGGWKILAFERERFTAVDRRTARDSARFNSLLRSFLGPEWQHFKLTGQL